MQVVTFDDAAYGSSLDSLGIEVDLLPLLPDFYAPIKDYQEIMTAESAELAQLQAFLNIVHDNFYAQTMDQDTVASWERLLNIQATAGETLEFRRDRIINRIAIDPPFTLNSLYAKLDEMLGVGKWSAEMDYANYALYIELAPGDVSHFVEVSYTVNSMKPAHISFLPRNLVTNDLLVSEEIAGSGISHNYKLASWSLGALPFESMYSEVVYKMASTPSVQSSLLSGIASFISTDISKARINGTIDISTLTKSSSGGVTTISYTVLQSQVSSINKIELLDSSNNVLTSINVYIPVGSDILIKHTLTTKEGV